MPVNPIFKRSGGSLIALLILQGQVSTAAEMPAEISIPKPVLSIIDDHGSDKDQADPSIIDQIESIEKKFFEHDFHSEDDRLQRLEQLVFGQSKTGEFTKRLNAIKDAAVQIDSEKQSSRNSPLEDSLSMLEKRFFQHDFHTEQLNQRISRLETLAFGAAKPGSPETRIKAIKKVLQNPGEIAAEEAATGAARSELQGSRKSAGSPGCNALIDEGVREFKAQRYHHAQDIFEKAISINPKSAEAYANLGGTLLMLKDKQGAEECFKACYALHPFGSLGQYAREEILKLVHDDAYSKTDPQDSQQTVARTVAIINRQSADRARSAQRTAAITAQNRLTLADIEIQKMTAETQQALYDLRARTGYYNYYRNGRMHYQRNAVDPYAEQEISNPNYIRSSYLRTDGQIQANLAANDGFQRATSAYESGNNLKDQLLQPVSRGGAHLRALGTSLYARYYGDGMPSTDDPPVVDASLPGLVALPKTFNSSRN